MSPARRTRLRRRLLWAGVVPLVLALALVAKVGAMLLVDDHGRDQFATGGFTEARATFSWNGVLNLLEPWVASYDVGTAAYRLSDFPAAIDALERALEDVPPHSECRVRVNLALAHESSGDAALADGRQRDARDGWQRGSAVLTAGACTASVRASPRESTAARTVQARLMDKLADAAAVSGDDVQLTQDDARARRLEQRNDEAQEQREDNERSREDEPDPPSDSPSSNESETPTYQW